MQYKKEKWNNLDFTKMSFLLESYSSICDFSTLYINDANLKAKVKMSFFNLL